MIYALFLAFVLFLLRFNFFRPPRKGITILLYHRISSAKVGSSLDKFTVSEKTFRRHIEFIRRLGYRFITPEEMDGAGEKSVLITFDDGYRDNLLAARVLKEYGIRGLFFISSAYIGSSFDGVEMLNEEDIGEMVKMGMYIGSHSHRHVKLSELPEDEIEEEIRESRRQLDRFCRVEDFAYPYGNRDKRVIEAVERNGFARGYIIGQKVYQPCLHSRFEIPRGIIRNTTTLLDLYLILTRGRSTF